MSAIESTQEIPPSSSQEFGSVRKPSTLLEPDVYITHTFVSDVRLWNAAWAKRMVTLGPVRIQTR